MAGWWLLWLVAGCWWLAAAAGSVFHSVNSTLVTFPHEFSLGTTHLNLLQYYMGVLGIYKHYKVTKCHLNTMGEHMRSIVAEDARDDLGERR